MDFLIKLSNFIVFKAVQLKCKKTISQGPDNGATQVITIDTQVNEETLSAF